MARILQPTNGVVVSPLLIEEAHLLALDKIFDDFVEERNREEDPPAASAKVSGRPKRSITIYLSAGRTVKSDHFADAIKQLPSSTEEPLGFRAHLEVGRVKASVNLTKVVRNVVQPVSATQFQVRQESPQLEFNVEPNDHSSAPELFGAIQNWAGDLESSASLRRWARYKPLFMILFAMWLLIGAVLPWLVLSISPYRFPQRIFCISRRSAENSSGGRKQ